jgi:Flp pilus assembly protein TadB
MNDQPDRRRPTRHGLVFAAICGAVVAAVAYLVAGGNPVWMLIVMIVIGVLFRPYAYLLIRRRGAEHPPWWKWL